METQLYCQPGEHGVSLSSGACVNYGRGGGVIAQLPFKDFMKEGKAA